MKQLVCEMCGGTDLLKDGGVFVCQTCGTKYSVEEAKKMMFEGTVTINRTNEVDNRLKNAISEYEAGNTEVASSLFVEILNIEPNNYQAIIFKALSEGWKSTVGDNRMGACSREIERGLSIMRSVYESDDEYADNCKKILIELKKLGEAVNGLHVKYSNSILNTINEFNRIQNGANLSGVGHAASGVIGGIMTGSPLLAITSLVGGVEISNAGGGAEARKMDQERVTTYNNGCGNTCIALNNVAVHILNDIQKPETVADSFYDDVISYMNSFKGYLTLDSVVKTYNEIVALCKAYKSKCREYFQEKRESDRKSYWEAHNDEYVALIAEKETIEKELSILKPQIDEMHKKSGEGLDTLRKKRDGKIQEEIDCDKQENLIRDLENQRNKCGVFQGKLKNELQYKIDQARRDLEDMKKKASVAKEEHRNRVNREIEEAKKGDPELTERYSSLKSRLSEINAEINNAGA